MYVMIKERNSTYGHFIYYVSLRTSAWWYWSSYNLNVCNNRDDFNNCYAFIYHAAYNDRDFCNDRDYIVIAMTVILAMFMVIIMTMMLVMSMVIVMTVTHVMMVMLVMIVSVGRLQCRESCTGSCQVAVFDASTQKCRLFSDNLDQLTLTTKHTATVMVKTGHTGHLCGQF